MTGSPGRLDVTFAALVALLSAIATTVVRAQDTGLESVRAAMAQSDYKSAVAEIDKRLFAAGTSAAGNDAERYALFMLRGECRLQMKDRVGAQTAFKSAAKAAGSPEQLADARGNALIVGRSTSGRYVPRFGAVAIGDDAGATGAAKPIDILPLEDRKRAMLAYRDELWSQSKLQLEQALRAEKLPAIEQVFERVAEADALERCATGQPGPAAEAMRQLGGHAYHLMRSEITRCGGRCDYLAQVANSSNDTALGWNSGRMGLTSQQRDEMKKMIPYLDQLRRRATEYRGIAAKVGGDAPKWDALVADAVTVIGEAESLYNDR